MSYLLLSPDQCDPAELDSQGQLLCGGELSRPAPIEEHYTLLHETAYVV